MYCMCPNEALSLLQDVVALGGRALEAEDRHLRAIAQGRGQHGGLLRTESERYYQFIVWKSVIEKYDAEVEYKYDGSFVDLVVNYNGVQHFFEMKNWRETPTWRMRCEIVRLHSLGGGFLLVFAANPTNMTDENIRLIRDLPGIGGSFSCSRFPTEDPKTGKPFEFWFAGWSVPSIPKNSN
jgi:hypothetical protein